jgi:hypothetical protein
VISHAALPGVLELENRLLVRRDAALAECGFVVQWVGGMSWGLFGLIAEYCVRVECLGYKGG